MTPSRFSPLVLLTAVAVMACRSGNESAVGRGRSGPGGTGNGRGAVSWFAGSAPLFLAPGRSPDRSLIVLADTNAEEPEGALLDSNGTFLRLDGSRSNGRVAITESAEGCTEASIDPAPDQPWGVGFIGRAPSAMAADSLHGMARRDSFALTVEAHRLASMLPNDSAGRFSGLPFSVVDLWRLRLPGGGTAIVATLRRQINQEDSPLQERTFLVAESDASAPDHFMMKYSERSSGAEETVESRDLLGIFNFSPAPTIDLMVARDFGDESAYTIIERDTTGKWTSRWTSRRFSC